MTVMDGVPDKKLVVVDHQLRKSIAGDRGKELDKHSAVRSCQAGGSGEGEWSRLVALHEACMGVQVHTGTRIHWDAHQTFLYESQGEGGGGVSKQILRENGFKKNLRKLRTTP